MSALQSIVAFAVFLGVLVTVHELGHFLVAKLCGVKVLKFSIGFGPRIFGFTRGETEYRVAWIPLGGYVKMAGEQPHDEVSPEDAKRSFLHQPWWKRAAIVIAGPVFNLVFPIIAYFFVNLGSVEVVSTRIGYVEPGNPAAIAGIKPGDRVKSVDGVEVKSFGDLREAFNGRFGRALPIVVDRDGQTLTLSVTPNKHVDKDIVESTERGLIGILPDPRAAVVGVPTGSPADAAGLKTFDRIAKIGDKVVRDELELIEVVGAIPVGTAMEVTVLRSDLAESGGMKFVIPQVAKVTVPRAEGEGFAALGGAEIGDLYVWTVKPETPAERAGVKRGDRIVAIDGKELRSYQFLAIDLAKLETKPFQLKWRSGTEEKTAELAQVNVTITDEIGGTSTILDLGMLARPVFTGRSDVLAGGARVDKVTLTVGPKDAFIASVKIVPAITRKIAIVIGKLFTGEVPFSSMGGPATIYLVASKSAEAGLDSYMQSMAILSINLGLMNLLPIPVLDGFALLAAIWEGIRRRPIPIRAREYANMVGLAMLALLMVMVLKNDIMRLIHMNQQ
ncbi:MAG: RIP metalloprotease RseP [Myxococcaceae bacterium]|nr:RIP metalloprotease RseP [Myxococcaceae bacterium]